VGDLRYADAGVDIAEGERAVSLIKRSVASTHTPSVIGGLGGFSGLFALDTAGYRNPVLASSTDSVGTKVKIAIATGHHRGIGVDLVNGCVNDIVCCGAKPLFFLDYYASGKLEPEHLAEIVDGVAEACRHVGCALIGGETAEMPGLYALSDYDIAGFVVGVVERDEIIDGSTIQVGDAVLGLPSSGVHSNGFSLIRHVINEQELSWDAVLPGTEVPLGELLLTPHRSYFAAATELRSAAQVGGLAHITGGGLLSNVPRILPDGLGVQINRDAWVVPPVFDAISRAGGIHDAEMWRTFNMGIGMVAIVPQADAARIGTVDGLDVIRLGRVVEAHGGQRVSIL
jgi:phosphoribosylformylglycinamidine cyclo-ligase